MINLVYYNNFLWLKWRRSVCIPQSYKELKPKEFIQLAPMIYEGDEKLKFEIKAFRILCHFSTFRFRLFPAELLERCLAHTAWVHEEKIPVQQLLPKYRRYHGPASDFDNLKMKEFHATERYYKEVVDAEALNSTASLNNLVAVLYRPGLRFYNKKKDEKGDVRIPFNHNSLPYYSAIISKWPMAVKMAIFLWYDACRQQLIDNNAPVFKEPSKYGYESAYDTGLYGVMRNLAGEKFGPVEKIEAMYVHTCMLELCLAKEEENFMEQQKKATA